MQRHQLRSSLKEISRWWVLWLTVSLRSMCNWSTSWRVSWHHTRLYIRTCRRSQNNQISSLSLQSLLSCGLPFTVFFSFTPPTFRQEHRFHSNKHLQKCFLLYLHIFSSFMCLWFSKLHFFTWSLNFTQPSYTICRIFQEYTSCEWQRFGVIIHLLLL